MGSSADRKADVERRDYFRSRRADRAAAAERVRVVLQKHYCDHAVGPFRLGVELHRTCERCKEAADEIVAALGAIDE